MATTLAGAAIEVERLAVVVSGGERILDGVTFAIAPGELVAILGASGAGKSTLLEVVSGARAADEGTVRIGRADVPPPRLGFVPEDDLLHPPLQLRRALRYAAYLRLPSATTSDKIDDVVATTLDALGLAHRASAPIRTLSGGERRRASIAAELLTRPGVLLLDEPTSGLDRRNAEELVHHLRALADSGATVVMSTHAERDLSSCDRVVVLASDGRVAFTGRPDAPARQPDAIAALLEGDDQAPAARAHVRLADLPARAGPPPGPLPQWAVLTARSAAVMASSRLTVAILVGSPVMVVAMLAVLFRPGAFDPAMPNPIAAVMTVFWIAFGAFFFGLTYGLLQLVAELPLLRRSAWPACGSARTSRQSSPCCCRCSRRSTC